MKLAILDDYQNLALGCADWAPARARGAEITVFDRHLGLGEDAARTLAPFDALVLMRERQPMPKSFTDRLPNLKFVVLTGARAASLDSAALTARKIPVSTTSGGPSGGSTAELAFGLLLDTARSMSRGDRLVRAGGWHGGLPMGVSLAGKRLGVVGLGNLGSRMAKFANAFEMDVVAWSPSLTAEKAATNGARLVAREELLATSDYISLHVVLNAKSRGMIGAAEFAAMKQGAVLINTSRGPLVDQDALLAALRSGKLGGAGLDVYDVEPLPAKHPLTEFDNVVLTPHLGYVIDTTFKAFYAGAVENVLAWLDGKPIRVMHPEALA